MWQLIQVSDDCLLLSDILHDQNIRMTWNFDWNIIINITYNVFVIRPIS